MKDRNSRLVVWGLISLLPLVAGTPSMAKDGTLSLRVRPKQAYVFIDGAAERPGGGSFRCSPGEHTLALYNYGYKSVAQMFTIAPGQSTKLRITLEPAGGEVSGPWGRIQLKGQPRAAVLLNGKTPDYFVGHVGEFDNGIIGKRQLLVPPGTYRLAVLRQNDTKAVDSGSVAVKPNESVIIYLDRNGEQVMRSWPRGERLKSLPRFKAGFGGTTVAVASVSGDFTLTPAKTHCGEPSELAWTTNGVVAAEIDGIGPVPASGAQTVHPKETTTYKFTASGPGGAFERVATLSVDKAVTASLSVTPQEVRYQRSGDKVVEQGTATLSWTTSNAEVVAINGLDSVNATRIGSVNASGSGPILPTPQKIDPGPVDETVTYTLTATNGCGGSETRTASLHITGSIEGPSPALAALETSLSMNSVYFPTALPAKRDPAGGLLQSQQLILTQLAGEFRKYLSYRADAHLILQAHADNRGSVAYNQTLSERRAERVRDFLVEQGVPPANLETVAYGKERNLDSEEVKSLEEENPSLSPTEKKKIFRNLPTHVLANNRRVDIVLSTTGQESYKFFPYLAADAKEILGAKARAARTPHKSRNKR